MTVLYVSSRYKPKYGGGEKFVDILISNLPQHKHIFLGGHIILHDIFKKKGFESHNYNMGFEPLTRKKFFLSPLSFFLSLFGFIKYIKLIKSSDLIVNCVSSFTEAIFLFPLIRFVYPQKRLIFLNHWGGITQEIVNCGLINLFRKSMSISSVVFVSHSQLALWSNYSLSSTNPKVIYNGVKVEPFKHEISTLHNSVKFGYLGRLYKDKGIDLIIKAFAEIKNINIKVEVIIAGSGEEEENLVKLQNSLNFNPNISFTWAGFITDTNNFYSSIDILIIPSRTESFGLVLVEAWEKGLPVIRSDIGVFNELSELTKLKEPKLVFHSEKVDELTKSILYAISNLQVLKSEAVCFKRHSQVEKTLSEKMMLVNYDRLFKEII
jgi:glycosyltransferase involved in cell wall biosynthesis